MSLPILRIAITDADGKAVRVRATFRSVSIIASTFDVECWGGDAHEGIDTTPAERLLASMSYVGDDTLSVDRRGSVANLVSLTFYGAPVARIGDQCFAIVGPDALTVTVTRIA